MVVRAWFVAAPSCTPSRFVAAPCSHTQQSRRRAQPYPLQPPGCRLRSGLVPPEIESRARYLITPSHSRTCALFPPQDTGQPGDFWDYQNRPADAPTCSSGPRGAGDFASGPGDGGAKGEGEGEGLDKGDVGEADKDSMPI